MMKGHHCANYLCFYFPHKITGILIVFSHTMKQINICLLILSISFVSCKKYRCPKTVYCGAGYNFLLVGYDSTEVDTVIMRAYKADNTFSTLIDTAFIADTVVTMSFNGPQYVWLPIFGTSRDTLLNGSLQLADKRVFDTDTSFVAYDWEIYIPKANRKYRITGIHMGGGTEQTVESCDQKGNTIYANCNQYLASFTIDGTQYRFSGADFMGTYNFIFLKK